METILKVVKEKKRDKNGNGIKNGYIDLNIKEQVCILYRGYFQWICPAKDA